MNQLPPDSRVAVRPLSIGLYLDQRAPHARSGEVRALAVALRELGHRVVEYVVVSALSADEGVVALVLPAPREVLQPDRVLRADLAALIQAIGCEAPAHDVHHAFDALTAQALLLAQPEALIVRTVTNLGRGASSYHEHMSAHTVRAARAVLAPSDALCGELALRYGIAPMHVDTGVDADAFAMAKASDVVALGVDLHLDSAGPILFTFGGLGSAAESTRILEAFVALRARHAGACWVAEGAALPLLPASVRVPFEEAFAKLSEADRRAVRLSRVFDAGERAAAYQLADAVVCLGSRETHLSWLLEAQAAGVPLLLSDDAGLREYVDPRCALWVEPDSRDSLRSGLLRISVHGRSDRRIVYAGYERAREWSWNRSATQHTFAYRRVLFGGEAGLRMHTARAARAS